MSHSLGSTYLTSYLAVFLIIWNERILINSGFIQIEDFNTFQLIYLPPLSFIFAPDKYGDLKIKLLTISETYFGFNISK